MADTDPSWPGCISDDALLAYLNTVAPNPDRTLKDLAVLIDPGMSQRTLKRQSKAGKVHAHYVVLAAGRLGLNRVRALEALGFVDASEVMDMADAERRRLGPSGSAEYRYTSATPDVDTEPMPDLRDLN